MDVPRENTFLPVELRAGADPTAFGRPLDEPVTYLETGIDGFFTDQADVGVAAKAEFLAGS